jgi:hypothetical protein
MTSSAQVSGIEGFFEKNYENVFSPWKLLNRKTVVSSESAPQELSNDGHVLSRARHLPAAPGTHENFFNKYYFF